MQEFFKSKLFKALFIISALLAGFITFEIFNNNSSILKSSIKFTVQPLIKTANSLHGCVAEFFDKFFQSGIYKEENLLLKKELAKNQKSLVEIDELKNENEQLKKALAFKKENSNYEIEMANFVAKDPNSICDFTIDIGKNRGIPLGATVLTNLGLVGKITKVEPNQSVVTTILNLEDNIPATINLKQEKGLICSNATLVKDGLCVLSHLPKTTKAAKGDLVYTSGSNNAYPANIVIGTILEVKLNDNGISREAIIKPAQNLNNIKDVMVVKKFLGTSLNLKQNNKN